MSQETAIPGAELPQDAMDGQPEGESITPDWQAIEEAFRAGAQSLREIAGEHGVTEGAIRARAKKAGWVRPAGVTQCVEPRIAALEEQVAALEVLVLEMGGLLEELARVNAGNLQRQRAPQAWKAREPPSRWG
jgi:hypothetical protein